MYPEKLYIKPTKRSPAIFLDNEKIFILGRSIIDNPTVFYEPVISWMMDFIKNWDGSTKIDLGFEYINTGSIKWLFLLLKELSAKKDLSANVDITWYFEKGDEDMCELGQIIRSLVTCHFSVKEIRAMNNQFYDRFLKDHSQHIPDPYF